MTSGPLKEPSLPAGPERSRGSNSLDFFVHPIPLSAVAIMAINDHWLKYASPSWVTGKLSDFTGVFYFPIFLLALATVVFWRWWKGGFTTTMLWAAILFTDALLIFVKLCAPGARFIETVFAEVLFKIQLIQDPTDLWALTMNVLTFLYLRKYLRTATDLKRPLQTPPDK